MNDRKIEQSDGRGIGWQQLLANSIEKFIPHEKEGYSLLRCPKFTKHKNLLTTELSQYSKSGTVVARFQVLQARRSWPTVTAADSETQCYYACPSDPPKSAVDLNDFAVKTFDCFLE